MQLRFYYIQRFWWEKLKGIGKKFVLFDEKI